jgi:hypothetical protein
MRKLNVRSLKMLRWAPAAGYFSSALAFGTPALMIPSYYFAVAASLANIVLGFTLDKQHIDRKKTIRTGIISSIFGIATAQFVVYGSHFN